MSGIFKRILGVARSVGGAYQERLNRYLRFEENVFDKTDDRSQFRYQSNDDSGFARQSKSGGVPEQVKDDLSLFGLTPPSSIEQVRQARNREVKKYHPDRHVGDPEKYQTAQEIMQMLNTAFDRLKTYYEKH